MSRMKRRMIAAGLFLGTGLIALALWPEADPAPTMGNDQQHHRGANPAEEMDELYTCGMHPQVLARKPGTCPICKMELTPARAERSHRTTDTHGGEDTGRTIRHWRAPMDPTYISDRPGKSPHGMDLVPVYEDEFAGEADAAISISPVVVQNMGVRTATVEQTRIVRTIRTVGSIDYDEQSVRDVTTKFGGWIEELFADYTGQRIERGMPLFRVYSPELYSSQEEYLLAIRNRGAVNAEVSPEAARDMRSLADSARLRLELFDISGEQIDELARRGAPQKTMTILSPHSGTVVEKTARDGMQVRPGMKLYTIADLTRVWVYADIYESEVAFVKIGQDARMELSYLPGETFLGKVIYVYPFVDPDTRTVKVRLEFDNPHLELKPGMFADVSIRADLRRDSLHVPRSAVLDTGRRRISFVALGKGRFEPRSVRTGVDLADDEVEILSGLHEGERVVTSGQFLLDSESKLREAVLKMLDRDAATAVAGRQVDEDGPEPESTEDAETATADHEDHAGHGHAASGNTSQRERAGGAAHLSSPLLAVMQAYLGLQQTLADDRAESVGATVEAMRQPLETLIAESAQGESPAEKAVRAQADAARVLVDRMNGRSLDGVRAQFNDLSRAITALLERVGPETLPLTLHAFDCPMAGGRWIQSDSEPRNPYYGFAMHGCGESIGLISGR